MFCHFLSFFCRFTTFFVIFVIFWTFFAVFFFGGDHFLSFPETSVIVLSLGQSFFVISRNLCHFFVIGAVFFFSGPESLSFFCHFCVISRTSVILSVIFGQSPARTLVVSICENPRPNYSTTMLASGRLKEP